MLIIHRFYQELCKNFFTLTKEQILKIWDVKNPLKINIKTYYSQLNKTKN